MGLCFPNLNCGFNRAGSLLFSELAEKTKCPAHHQNGSVAAYAQLVQAGSVFHALDGIVFNRNEIDTAEDFAVEKIMFQSPITTVSRGQQQALDEAAAKAITQD